jgi:hypothetical protein
MELIKSPTIVGCLPTSLAMVLGRSFQDIIPYFGHDGLKVLWPEAQGIHKYRGFSEWELIEVCYAVGYACLPIPMCPAHYPPNHKEKAIAIFNEDQTLERVNRWMDGNIGIIKGYRSADLPHACAWDGSLVYDPAEPRTYSFNDPPDVDKIMIDTFYVIESLK